MKRQITIKDIALKLGLSTSTVSRALKDHPDISPKTRAAVKELAALLGYRPNRIALNLRNNSTSTIGLIIPEIEHYFFSAIINGIEEVAYKNDYSVMVFQSNESYKREVINTQAVLTNRVDGVLVSFSKETNDFSHFQKLIDNEIPVVFFDRVIDELQADQVVADDYQGAFLAVNHLIEKGCKRIAHFAAPQHLAIGKSRLSGYHDALLKHNIPFDQSLVVLADTFDSARKSAHDILRRADYPTGFFAVNDMAAIAIIKEAKHLGLHVPEDIKVVGFENSKSAAISEPELTTVDQFGFELGREACQLLLKRLKNEENETSFKPIKKVIKTRLVVRSST
ncbi:MAG TPA: LacI family DNA-binding transcriptional regulator [Bacteroidales bacterium]|jgi:LacI family transcriptional regulator|nr:LacI family DNA-binding transcriptional regulator [Bacteroidales bacterium]MDY0085747.1 LacI family DNA-binding transcriptional regulator [Bacteroidales bacterium]HPE43465.1 LacI family DNA-binding transcriptional regulator [Bacteroidales bacterium]